MKLISWNVNGIRAGLRKGFLGFLKEQMPDILCVQETKARPEDVDWDPMGYAQYWNSAQKKGYEGTLILSRKKPLSVVYGMDIEEHDREGRVITAEYDDFYLVNVYTPNSKRGLERLPYRMACDKAFLKHCKKLERKKPVIFCGDLNVAHKEIDLMFPKQNVKNHGFTPEERKGFDAFVKHGFIDTFREFCHEGGHYSWWSQMHKARERNIGWRIDYFCVSAALKSRLEKAEILSDVMGSDHCPVLLQLKRKTK